MEKQTQWKELLLQKAASSPYREKRIVFGYGEQNPRIMLIGEAPGGEEEKQGRPFVGKAGANLTEFLETLGIQREDVYISNVVKIRPTKISPKTGKPVNRPPSKEEFQFFLPFLKEEIAIMNPQWIVTLGNVPLRAVTGDDKAVIGDYHGKEFQLPDGRRLFPLYHPAAVIYNRSLSAVYHEDLMKLRGLL